MHRLDIYICTKSKCTAKKAQLKLRSSEAELGVYNGPALLEAIRNLVAHKDLETQVEVHEAACMAGCPVGPRVDMVLGSRRIMYFQRKNPTGREDLISWISVGSVEEAIDSHLRES
jgi:predicted metal-binding protein